MDEAKSYFLIHGDSFTYCFHILEYTAFRFVDYYLFAYIFLKIALTVNCS